MNFKQQMDELTDEVIRYHYMMLRQGREKKVKDLNEYVRRKVNEKFRERNIAIINSYLNQRFGEK